MNLLTRTLTFAGVLKKCLLLGLIGTTLPACSYLTGEDGFFRDKKEDYLKAQTLPRTEIPDGLDSYTLDDLLVVPEVAGSGLGSGLLQVPAPRPITANTNHGVLLQKLGSRRWLVVDATPNQVWPRIRDYWAQRAVGLDQENPTRGVLETTWVRVAGDESKKDKFRISIEPGLRTGSSEVRVLHLNVAVDAPVHGQVNWPQQSLNFDREQEILQSIANYLAERMDSYQASAVSLLAGSIQEKGKAQLRENDEGQQILQLDVDFDRAWASLAQALERSDAISVDEADVESAFFIVQVDFDLSDDSVVESKPGFFKRWLGIGSGNFLGRRGAGEQHRFQITVNKKETAVEVVATFKGNSLEESSATAEQNIARSEKLLRLINENLT